MLSVLLGIHASPEITNAGLMDSVSSATDLHALSQDACVLEGSLVSACDIALFHRSLCPQLVHPRNCFVEPDRGILLSLNLCGLAYSESVTFRGVKPKERSSHCLRHRLRFMCAKNTGVGMQAHNKGPLSDFGKATSLLLVILMITALDMYLLQCCHQMAAFPFRVIAAERCTSCVNKFLRPHQKGEEKCLLAVVDVVHSLAFQCYLPRLHFWPLS